MACGELQEYATNHLKIGHSAHGCPAHICESISLLAGLKLAKPMPVVSLHMQADDSGCPIKVERGREASPSELSSVLEVAQEYTERRDAPHSAMQTVSQIIT